MEQMQTPTAKHQAEFEKSCGKVDSLVDRIEEAGEVKDTIRPVEWTNLPP
jgi:hypothetical protein